MLDRAWGGTFRWRRDGRQLESHKSSRVARRPLVESLEGRQLLAASLTAITSVTVAAQTGIQVPLNGSSATSPPTQQTFTVSSSNPDIAATVAKGSFVTVNVTHTAAPTVSTDISFTGPFTYQLFQDLTPNTANRIQTLTNAQGYNGKQIFRVVPQFDQTRPSGGTNVVFQGGPNPDTGTNPEELNPQLQFNAPGAVAIAKTTSPNTDGNEFFVTTGPQPFLNYGYTIFGQVVSGQDIVADIGKVALQKNSAGDVTSPVSPITITTASVSSANPNGVVHVDATKAKAGETGVITVTATDPATNTTAVQKFTVTVGAATTFPATATFTPVTLAPTPSTLRVISGQQITFQTPFNSNNPGNNAAVVTTLPLVTKPAHGTVVFNTATKTAVYTANAGYVGTDTFSYQTLNTNSTSGATPTTAKGNTVSVSVNVVASTAINTGAVRVIGNVLVVTPPPTTLKATNTILVSQFSDTATLPAVNKLMVTLNGKTDLVQPAVGLINRVVVYGSKASDVVTIEPGVDKTINVTLDSGHAGKNTLQAGAGPTREHGWFGQNTLIGGTGANQLVGRAGHVKFKPTATTNEIFAGTSHPGYYNFRSYNGRVSYQIQPPGGTFYKFVNGHLTPIPTPKSTTKTTPK